MNRIQSLRTHLDQQKGRRSQIERHLDDLNNRVRDARRGLHRHEQAREIIREVGLRTQQQLQVHISDITSLALEAVFDDPYELVVEFVQRRNKTECDLYFQRDGQRVDPISASGGGAVDVAAFALRIAAWSMQTPRSRNTIILDEPLRFLSEDLQEQASRMIKELSERLGIQFVIITHEETLAQHADKTFEVRLRKGVSRIV
jgi:DNA repair exonuclease SbcCD ATPase subunit